MRAKRRTPLRRMSTAGILQSVQKPDTVKSSCKNRKKSKKKESLTVFLLICENQVAVKTRTEKGVLQGMWEFPNISEHLTKQQSSDFLTEKGIAISRIIHSAKRKHIFTHIEWDMTCYCFLIENKTDAFVWADRETLVSEIALPTAFKQFLPLIMQEINES